MKTKKQLLGILLSLMLMLGLMPGMSLTAYAATAYRSGRVRITDVAVNDIISKDCELYKNNSYALEIYDTDGTTLLKSYGSSGFISNVQPGYYTIVVQAGRTVKIKKLSEEPAVTSVTLDKDTLSLTVGGETATLTASVTANYDTVKTVNWSSSDTSVATINNGVVTPVSTGTATITVTNKWDSTKTATCAVTVEKGNPTAPIGLTAILGQTLADVELSDGWTWVDSTQSVGSVGSNTFKANFAENDNYNAASNVDVTVTVTKPDNPATVTDTATVKKGGNTIDLADNVTLNGATGAVSYEISGEANGCTLNGSKLTSGENTGSVTVNVSVAEDDNYNALAATPITVTISDKYTQTITASDVTATYGDTDKKVSASLTKPATGGGTISYAVKDGSETYIDVASDGKLTIKKVPSDGKAYVIVTAAETDDYAQATIEVTVTINTKAMTVSAEDVNVTVDGQSHGITVNVTDPASGATVKYGTEEGSYTLDASPTQTEVGTQTVYYQVTADNYTTYTGSATVTVSDKSTQTITASDVTATYGETGKKVEATTDGNGAISYAVKDGSADYIEVNASTGALTIKKVPADGKAYVVVTAAETAAYAQATKEVTVTINKANAAAATVTANNRTYDGTDKPLVNVTGEATGGTMQYAIGDANGATQPYTTSIPTVTNAGTYYVWYKVKGDKDHLDSEPACVEAAIAKRNVTLTSAEDSKDYDGKPLTNNNITVTGDGWAEGEGATYNVTGTQTIPGASDNGFTYTLNNNTKEPNYNISKVINKLTVNDRTEKYEINVEVNSDTVTYDGNEHEVSGFKTLEFLCDDVTYTVSGLSASVIGTDAGTYDVVVTGTPLVKNSDDKDLTKQFIVNIVPGQLVIDTRNVSFTSASDTKQYDGEPLTNDNVEITGDGFAEGEGALFDVTGKQIVVGSSANTFTYTLNEGTNPDNYSITSQEGTLTVTNRLAKYEIIPKANSGEFTYDGSEHSVTGFVTDTFEVATNDETTHIYTLSGLTAEGIGTDVGEYTVNITGTPVVIDAEGNDVSSEFSVTPVAGNIVINKRNVTLTSASDSKAYDGKELTNAEVTVSGDGWAEGEGAEYKVTGTRKLPGETRNSFTYTLNEGTNADNYEITSVEGTLTITDRKAEDEEGSDKDVRYEITVVAKSGNFTYDGTEHEVSGVESTEFTINDVTYTVSGLEASAKGTEVGTYPVKISGTPVVTDADGNDLTKQFTVNTKEGKLTVVEKSVNPEGDIRYSNYSGDRAVWTKGSNAGCEFVFKRSVDDELTFGHFTGIDVESKAVDASNYTAVSGSVVITLKPEYLETLAVGDHLLTANFDDGNSVTVKFTIKEKSEEKKSDTTLNNKKADVTPETGDAVNVQLIFLVMVLSMCVIFALCNLRSKLDEKKRRR